MENAVEQVIDAVAEWIDTYVIACAICDHISDTLGEAPTIERCRDLWLDALEHLHENLRR